MLAEQVGCTRRLTAARDPQFSVEGERTMSLTYRHFSLIALVVLLAAAGTAAEVPAHLAEEFRVKREGPFEFAEKPAITRDGDTVTIRFKTKAFCDVTIAVEDGSGRILRHLASGVLGKNPPPPFQKDSLAQTIIWDSKYDQGAYVDDRENTVIRVSLGLKPRYERHFLWSPHRRFTLRPPSFAAQPEGVYVSDGRLTDFIYLFDHDGNYVRTVYPFPSNKLGKLVGVRTRVFEQSGERLPWKGGFLRSTLLTCGGNTRLPTSEHQAYKGLANSAMTIRDGRIALAYYSLNRLATDGTTGGMPLEGPETHLGYLFPRSIALSPDGKTAYVTGFHALPGNWGFGTLRAHWARGVGRVDFAKGKKGDKMTVFAGALSSSAKAGGDKPGQFKTPTSVAVDKQGRVYVTDVYNHRVQVFDPSGKHLKDIKVHRPGEVCVSPLDGHIYVFTWAVDDHVFRKNYSGYSGRSDPVSPKLTHFGPFENPKVLGEYSFRYLDGHWNGAGHRGTHYRAIIDFWAPKEAGLRVWILSGVGRNVHQGALRILQANEEKKTLEDVKNFTKVAAKTMPSLHSFYRSQICVNPKTGELWLPLRNEALVMKPETGHVRKVKLPQGPKEMAFDIDGHAYFSAGVQVSRFAVSDSYQWREVPFDYGEAKGGRIAALTTGGQAGTHSGGVSVSPKGHVLVAVVQIGVKERDPKKERARIDSLARMGVKKWTPEMYRGRGGCLIVRVWDKHGKVLYGDAVQGIGYCHNVFMDKNDDIYLAAGAKRKGYTDLNTGTLVKVKPKARILTTSSVLPLGPLKPERPHDTESGNIGTAWWKDVEWFYGGIGFNGKNSGGIHKCHCSQFRITHDYYARTFVPETVHYTVGVVDSAGNLIMRIGQYGNIDDGVPLVKDPRIPNPRSLGGDEVGLFHPAYLAVHSDRRLFINDFGNDHIVSVKLGYHVDHRTALKDVKEKPTDE
jgi:hypothetical protein